MTNQKQLQQDLKTSTTIQEKQNLLDSKKKLDVELKQLQEAQKQLELQLLEKESQAGGNLPKRLHPKKKYSKKTYQFSKSKNRTKKQLI